MAGAAPERAADAATAVDAAPAARTEDAPERAGADTPKSELLDTSEPVASCRRHGTNERSGDGALLRFDSTHRYLPKSGPRRPCSLRSRSQIGSREAHTPGRVTGSCGVAMQERMFHRPGRSGSLHRLCPVKASRSEPHGWQVACLMPMELALSGCSPPLLVGRRKSTEKVGRQKGLVSAFSQLTNLYVEPSHPL